MFLLEGVVWWEVLCRTLRLVITCIRRDVAQGSENVNVKESFDLARRVTPRIRHNESFYGSYEKASGATHRII